MPRKRCLQLLTDPSPPELAQGLQRLQVPIRGIPAIVDREGSRQARVRVVIETLEQRRHEVEVDVDVVVQPVIPVESESRPPTISGRASLCQGQAELGKVAGLGGLGFEVRATRLGADDVCKGQGDDPGEVRMGLVVKLELPVQIFQAC